MNKPHNRGKIPWLCGFYYVLMTYIFHIKLRKSVKNATRNLLIKCTLTKIRIDKVIVGESPETEVITLFQLGKPENADIQTKVQKSEQMLLLLTNSPIKGRYYSTDLEHTMFYIEENGTLTSMSNLQICARYDERSKETLFEDILNTEYSKSLKQISE